VPERHFIDLHIHSRYSRATSKALTPANLSRWAEIKGLSLLGTGDLTHPAWRRELAESLEERDDGFYSLRGQPDGPRFIPTGEVSAIYKQDGRTRKIHLVIISPDLAAADEFSRLLGAFGRLEADGRPILGLTARQILDIALTSHPATQVVPAHIWTPWFSLFGARSGFDHLEECFGDLSLHITALETGLSSDPDMNRLVSALDSRALISSSDAHSPEKLGREATIIRGPLTRTALAEALAGGQALGGTVEFFPEEGKYHLDGHADCGPPLTPAETRALGGLCPVCGRPLTIGVLHRISQLADRDRPGGPRLPDQHLLPLAELLGQIFGRGPTSRGPTRSYELLTREFGGELPLLLEAGLDDLGTAGGPLLRLGVERMRQGRVTAVGGFDGRFGTITAIGPEDRAALAGQGRLFQGAALDRNSATCETKQASSPKQRAGEMPQLPLSETDSALFNSTSDMGPGLSPGDESQDRAVTSRAPALAVVAGPGGGKTLVLVRRAAWLIQTGLARPEEVLMTTFTRKAAEDLAPRLAAVLPGLGRAVKITTLHGLAHEFLKTARPDWSLAPADFLTDLLKRTARPAGLTPAALTNLISLAKNRQKPDQLPARALESYQAALTERRLWDFDDLILLAAPPTARPFRAVLVDEFQDLSPAQFDFLARLLGPAGPDRPGALTVIGDPDQSIYSFRGADPDLADRLAALPGGLTTVTLSANYRSTSTILKASESLWPQADRPGRRAARGETGPEITRAVLPTAGGEAAYVVKRLTAHLGLLKLGLGASNRQDAEFMPGLNFGDIAILFRLRALGPPVAEALTAAGLPWQMCGDDPLTAADHLDWTADKISLLTMHAAKGLEFKLVFVIGVEAGLCPYLRPAREAPENSPDPEPEERRLFYVALTRARDRLYLTRAARRRLYGQTLAGEPSPFWSALPRELCVEPPAFRARRAGKPKTLFDLL
jgi:DNA helicase-2/ATP-dependent DNA helicase PcrA